jgi:antitoxin component YwqK of YwqJK toxin-antitoxin module
MLSQPKPPPGGPGGRLDRAGATQPWILLLVVGGLLLLALPWLRRALRTDSPNLPLPHPLEVARTNLQLEGGRLLLAGTTNVFTGLMVEHYPNGKLRSRSAVSNGLLQGSSLGWFTNGQLQVSEHFLAGVSHGVRTKWYPDGTKQSEATIAAGRLDGPFLRWHTNGTLSERALFKADRPEGESLSFFPSGFLQARVVMTNGQPAEQKFYRDGEQKP